MTNYNGKIFKQVVNAENGEISDETIFSYDQSGYVLTGEYEGRPFNIISKPKVER